MGSDSSAGPYRDPAAGAGEEAVEPQPRCATCGRELDGDPDEDVAGDAGASICGECARSRDFFVLDIIDGELDAEIE